MNPVTGTDRLTVPVRTGPPTPPPCLSGTGTESSEGRDHRSPHSIETSVVRPPHRPGNRPGVSQEG
jgi:hypothetical protein